MVNRTKISGGKEMSNDDKSGIYKIVLNGKMYVGSTTGSFKKRWQTHLSSLKNGNHHNPKLQKSFNENKTEEVIFSILEIIENKLEVIPTEQKYIDMLKPEYNGSQKASNPLNVYKTKKFKNGKPITYKPTKAHRETTEAIADRLNKSLSDYVREAVEHYNKVQLDSVCSVCGKITDIKYVFSNKKVCYQCDRDKQNEGIEHYNTHHQQETYPDFNAKMKAVTEKINSKPTMVQQFGK